MEIHWKEFFGKMLALEKKFNESKDPVTKFAVLAAFRIEFQTQVKWLSEEEERWKKRATDTILSR